MLTEGWAKAIVAVVTVVWAANFGARFAVAGYEPSESINAIFMAIVGGTFALKAKGSGNGNGNGNGSGRTGGRHGK